MIVRVSGLVWLPKVDLNNQQLINIKNTLTIIPRRTTDISAKADPEPIFMFEETENEIGVPREWYLKNVTKEHEEILDVSYGTPMKEMETLYKSEGHFADQENALRVFENKMDGKKWCGFMLRAGCGYGKTSCALEFARRFGLSTVILVHKEFFVEQWRNAIKFFMPEARIGIIQQNKCDYKNKDFVIGMIQSLSRDSGEKYPDEMYRSFGTLISDEVHRVSSQTWNGVIYAFNAAYRVGLSATPRRKDGTEAVFFNHVSDITYSASVDSQVPLLRVVKTDTELKPIRRGTYFVAIKDLNSAQLISQLVSDTMRTRDIVDQVLLAAKAGRKVMVVSERLEHLKEMSELFDASVKASNIPFNVTYDFYTGEWFTGEVWHERTKTHKKGELKKKKRSSEDLYKAESANVIFATKQCTEEGLDIPAIDVLVLTTPLSDPEQTVGRVRRWCTPREDKCKHLCPWRAGVCTEKPTPVVTDVVDVKIQKLYGKWLRRQKFYKEIGTIKKTGEI